jgi:hypothetical protein
MSLPTSFIRIDRHAVSGARPACVCILLGFVGLIFAAALHEPSRAESQAVIEPAALAADALVSSQCIPHDGSVGTEGGDPYGFYVFSRDQDLALHRLRACALDVAGAAEGEPVGQGRTRYETVAQASLPQPSPVAP